MKDTYNLSQPPSYVELVETSRWRVGPSVVMTSRMSYVVSHAFFRRTRVRNKGVTKHVHKVRVVTIVLSQILDQKIVLSQILD